MNKQTKPTTPTPVKLVVAEEKKSSEQSELEKDVPDPTEEEAEAAIAANTVKGCPS